MKLSQAIRKGIEMCGTQAFGAYFVRRLNTRVSAEEGLCPDSVAESCAYGAAINGFVGKLYDGDFEELNLQLSPYVRHELCNRFVTECPECRKAQYQGIAAKTLVIHLNDDHEWTREVIADYIEKEVDGKLSLE